MFAYYAIKDRFYYVNFFSKICKSYSRFYVKMAIFYVNFSATHYVKRCEIYVKKNVCYVVKITTLKSIYVIFFYIYVNFFLHRATPVRRFLCKKQIHAFLHRFTFFYIGFYHWFIHHWLILDILILSVYKGGKKWVIKSVFIYGLVRRPLIRCENTQTTIIGPCLMRLHTYWRI